jgi:hypothetical protein
MLQANECLSLAVNQLIWDREQRNQRNYPGTDRPDYVTEMMIAMTSGIQALQPEVDGHDKLIEASDTSDTRQGYGKWISGALSFAWQEKLGAKNRNLEEAKRGEREINNQSIMGRGGSTKVRSQCRR